MNQIFRNSCRISEFSWENERHREHFLTQQKNELGIAMAEWLWDYGYINHEIKILRDYPYHTDGVESTISIDIGKSFRNYGKFCYECAKKGIPYEDIIKLWQEESGGGEDRTPTSVSRHHGFQDQ